MDKGRTNTEILLAEDDEFSAVMMEAALKSMGAVIQVASSGEEAIELTKSTKFDIVFMDCQMPNLDGIEASRYIRETKNENKNVPIIALTATASEELQETCMAAGMNQLLQKPLNTNTLRQIIDQYVVENPTIGNKEQGNEELSADGEDFLYEAAENLSKVMHFSYKEALSLLDDFTRMAIKILYNIEAAQIDNREKEIVKYAHQLKGMACSMRLRGIQQLASDIEKKQCATRDTIQALTEQINKLKPL
jgi:CheY-like chemotaxis protein